MPIVLQTLVLTSSFAFVFFWQNSPLSDYTIQVLGTMVVLFLMLSARRKGFYTGSYEQRDGKTIIFILNTTILLLIFSTGGMFSTLFFLVYFLCFGIAFVFRPALVFVYAILLILVFIPEIMKHQDFANTIRPASVLLIAPLAFFFGREFQRKETLEEEFGTLEEKTQKAAEKIQEDAEALKTSPQSQSDETKLDEIITETTKLKKEVT